MLAAIEIEQSVLGSFIIAKTATQHIEALSENDFTVEIHKIIFNEIKKLQSKSKLDILNLSDSLKNKDIKVSYLSELTVVAQVYAIDNHIKNLKEKTKKRNIIKHAQNLIDQIVTDVDVNKIIYDFESKVKEIADKDIEVKDDVFSIADKFLDYMYSDDKAEIKFSIKFLDEIIGGLYKGELTTIAAKSGVGKTALALQIARAALKQHKRVLFISREMSDIQMFMRNITSLTGISSKKIKNKTLTEEEQKEIVRAVNTLTENENLFINDNLSKISEIKRRIRQVRPDLVIIDYLQLLTPETNLNNREREVATLSREIKNMTLDFNIPIIQLSQLNDELKDCRPSGERPMRDSKAIYHDSNNVIYIHEPVGSDLEDACANNGLNVENVKAAKERYCVLLDLIVAKCRDGGKSMKQHWYAGDRLFFQECIGGAKDEKYKQNRYKRKA